MEVNYLRFLKEIKDINGEIKMHISTSPQDYATHNDSRCSELKDVLMKMKRHSLIYEKDVSNFLKGYDKLRKGYVSESKFKHSLSILEMELTEADYNSLILNYHFYENSCKLINYVKMLQDLHEIKLVEEESKNVADIIRDY